jgi:hypothetical protein
LLHFAIGTAEGAEEGAMGRPFDPKLDDVAFHKAVVAFLWAPVPDNKKASRLGGFFLDKDCCKLDQSRPNRHRLLNTQELNKNEGNNNDVERDR